MKPCIINLDSHLDSRGALLTFAIDAIPFNVVRIFTISVNLEVTKRGGHSHKECWQAIFPVSGGIEITVIEPGGVEDFFILRSGSCLILPPQNWVELKFLSNLTHVVVLASHPYDKNDYVYEKPKHLKKFQ